MEIRFGKSQEKNQLKALWKEIFNEDKFYLEYKFDKNFNCSQSIVVVDNNIIIGSAHYDICYIDNKKCAYVNGVSIKEEYRGLNLSRKMLDFLHNHLKQQDFAFCFLKPAIDNYYEKFGYKTIYQGRKITLNTSLPHCNYNTACSGYLEIFQKACNIHHCFLPRTQDKFQKLIKLYENYGGGMVCFEKDNMPLGYCLWCKEENKITIEESVFLDENETSVLKDYFKTDVEIVELPVMVKDLNEHFNYETSFIKVI